MKSSGLVRQCQGNDTKRFSRGVKQGCAEIMPGRQFLFFRQCKLACFNQPVQFRRSNMHRPPQPHHILGHSLSDRPPRGNHRTRIGIERHKDLLVCFIQQIDMEVLRRQHLADQLVNPLIQFVQGRRHQHRFSNFPQHRLDLRIAPQRHFRLFPFRYVTNRRNMHRNAFPDQRSRHDFDRKNRPVFFSMITKRDLHGVG